MSREVEHTDDGHWIVVGGRRWAAQDPQLPDDVRTQLLHHLGVGRSGVRAAKGDPDAVAVARARVQLAKTGLGERGPRWWDQTDLQRRERWEAALAALDDAD